MCKDTPSVRRVRRVRCVRRAACGVPARCELGVRMWVTLYPRGLAFAMRGSLVIIRSSRGDDHENKGRPPQQAEQHTPASANAHCGTHIVAGGVCVLRSPGLGYAISIYLERCGQRGCTPPASTLHLRTAIFVCVTAWEHDNSIAHVPERLIKVGPCSGGVETLCTRWAGWGGHVGCCGHRAHAR